jgi:hypothetical protein
MYLYEQVLNISRASANDATDDDHVVIASVYFPPNALKVGQTIEIESEWTCTNSGNTKNFTMLADATSFFSQSQTTLLAFRYVNRLHVVSATQLRYVSGTPGYGSLGVGAATITVDIAAGVTIAARARWTTQPISAETITLEYLRAVVYG